MGEKVSDNGCHKERRGKTVVFDGLGYESEAENEMGLETSKLMKPKMQMVINPKVGWVKQTIPFGAHKKEVNDEPD